jgi:hypothetical protein
VALLGDPGEGDASQYVVVPVLERVAGDTDLAVLCSDVIYPAGGITEYADRFYRAYADYPGPIYRPARQPRLVRRAHRFMTTFCDAPPDAGAPSFTVSGPWWKRLLRAALWRRAPLGTARTWPTCAGTGTRSPSRPASPAVLRDRRRPGPAGPDRHRHRRPYRRRAGPLAAPVSAGDRPKILLTGRPSTPTPSCSAARSGRPTAPSSATSTRSSPTPPTTTSPRSAATTTTTSATRCGCATGAPCSTWCRRVRAYLSATHQIPNVDRLQPAVHEENFRCYPLAATRSRTSAAATTRSCGSAPAAW